MADLVCVLIVLVYYFVVCFYLYWLLVLDILLLMFRLLGLCLLPFLIAFQLSGWVWCLLICVSLLCDWF